MDHIMQLGHEGEKVQNCNVVFLFCLSLFCVLCPMLYVSLYSPFLNASLVFSTIYSCQVHIFNMCAKIVQSFKDLHRKLWKICMYSMIGNVYFSKSHNFCKNVIIHNCY